MSTNTDATNSVEFKYTFDETAAWAKKENEPLDSGISFLYIFSALAFLLIFAAFLLFFIGKESDSPITIKINEQSSELETTTSEIHTEYDLLDDAGKDKNTIQAAKA